MALPLLWVDRIFDKLTLTYGQAFLARWRDIDINAVKSDWMHELSGFEAFPSAIAHALSNLPDKPPSIVDFKTLCRSAPAAGVPRIESPKADPERVKAELAKLAPLRNAPALASTHDPRAWAKAILRDYTGGLRRSPAVVAMARNALGEPA